VFSILLVSFSLGLRWRRPVGLVRHANVELVIHVIEVLWFDLQVHG
jgi:hypothetical protein